MENRKWVNYHTDKRRFLDKTKNKIYIKEEVTEIRDQFQTDLRVFYHNDKIVGCMIARCGYDRGPKLNEYITDLISTIKEVYKHGFDSDLFNLTVENAENKLNRLKAELEEKDE